MLTLTSIDRLRDYADAVAERWIGWSFPPVQHAVKESGWCPDERSDYCARCGDSVAFGEATPEGCGTCRTGAELAGGFGDGVVRLGPYTGALRDWIVQTKYHRWNEMGERLGMMLGVAIRKAVKVDQRSTAIVPMPMPWQRRLYRGIDHAKVMAHAAANELRIPVVQILQKTNRPPQVVLTPSERRRSGSRGLAIRRRWGGWPLNGLTIVLIDDVRTTGATLKSAVRLVRSLKPQQIICAVCAVADSKSRRDRTDRPTQS